VIRVINPLIRSVFSGRAPVCPAAAGAGVGAGTGTPRANMAAVLRGVREGLALSSSRIKGPRVLGRVLLDRDGNEVWRFLPWLPMVKIECGVLGRKRAGFSWERGRWFAVPGPSPLGPPSLSPSRLRFRGRYSDRIVIVGVAMPLFTPSTPSHKAIFNSTIGIPSVSIVA
jgi:hypothetical protein